MAINKRLRYEVLRRDNHSCRYCGAHPPDIVLTVDHVVPTALGGTNEPTNLVAACRDCNAGKTSSMPDAPMVADVEQEAMRWSRAMRAAADTHAGVRETRDQRRERFLRCWNGWTYETGSGERKNLPLPQTWPDTIDRLLSAGLISADLDDAVSTTMRARGVKDEFSYFAGICWRWVKERQEIASALLETGDVD